MVNKHIKQYNFFSIFGSDPGPPGEKGKNAKLLDYITENAIENQILLRKNLLPNAQYTVIGDLFFQIGLKEDTGAKGPSNESCTIRYGNCDGAHWGNKVMGMQYLDRLGGSV